MTETTLIVRVLVTVLVPIVPAYILYKNLPSKAMVKGPFKGLDIQLSGAFGGYFLVLLFIGAFTLPDWSIKEKMIYEVWEVRGKARTETRGEHINREDITIAPPLVDITVDGNVYKFKFDVPVKRDQTGELEFPTLIIQHNGYASETIDLGPNTEGSSGRDYKIKRNANAKKISIDNTVILERIPEDDE